MSNTKKIKVKKKKDKEEVKNDQFTQTIRESLKSMGKQANPYQEQMLVQLLKSFLVGGVATILDIILYIVLCIFIDPLLSNVISMLVTISLGLVIGIRYVYDKRSRKTMITRYIVLNSIGLLVTEGMIYGLVSIKEWNAILVKILAIILIIVFKTIMNRFVFSKKTS